MLPAEPHKYYKSLLFVSLLSSVFLAPGASESFMPGQMPASAMQEMYPHGPPAGMGMGPRAQYPYGPGFERR